LQGAGENGVRDYRLEIGCREADGGFRTLSVYQFRSLDVREARTKADVWVAGMKPSLEGASHVMLFAGASAVCGRPIDRRVWETLG
jgi:hypothetical protein